MFSLANNLLVSVSSVKYFCIDTLVLQVTFAYDYEFDDIYIRFN